METTFSPEFRQQLNDDGWMPEYITEVADQMACSPNPLRSARSLLNEKYTDQRLREGLYRIEKDWEAPLVAETIRQILRPWCAVDGPLDSLLPCNISVIEIARRTGLSAEKVIKVIQKYQLTLKIGPQEFLASVEVPESPQDKRLKLKDVKNFGISPKRATRKGRYESRAPGGGPVQRARVQNKRLDKAIKAEARQRARIAFQPISEAEKAQDAVPGKRISPIKKAAEELGLTPSRYLELLNSANRAYDTFVALGPLYGAGEKGKTPPSFRVAAEPVCLPAQIETNLALLGSDLLLLAQALPYLPEEYRMLLGDVDFSTSFSWRIDAILTPEMQIQVNEVQVNDGADALMVAERLAYGLGSLEDSTAAAYVKAFRGICATNNNEQLKIAWLCDSLNVREDPYISNNKRMAELIYEVSRGKAITELIESTKLAETAWDQYDGVINGAYVSPAALFQAGVRSNQLLSAGDYSALGNKEIFSLLRESRLKEFWLDKLGAETYERLKSHLIESRLVTRAEEISNAQGSKESVVKVFWAGGDMRPLDCARGVFGPWTSRDDWAKALKMFDQGYRFICQPFIQPAKISALLRAQGGKALQHVEWFNRICCKYVVDPITNPTNMTAVEATLGENIIPAGRGCCFAPVIFR